MNLVLMFIMSEAGGNGNGNDDTDANDDTKETNDIENYVNYSNDDDCGANVDYDRG